jgi:hypothetical protein
MQNKCNKCHQTCNNYWNKKHQIKWRPRKVELELIMHKFAQNLINYQLQEDANNYAFQGFTMPSSHKLKVNHLYSIHPPAQIDNGTRPVLSPTVTLYPLKTSCAESQLSNVVSLWATSGLRSCSGSKMPISFCHNSRHTQILRQKLKQDVNPVVLLGCVWSSVSWRELMDHSRALLQQKNINWLHVSNF